jgi:queuosine precursor transporter
MMFTALYVLSVVLVNYGFSVVPLIQLPSGDMWPPMSLAVGFIFVVRDFAQREVGHKILWAMLIGGAISWFMASPMIAVASVVAFSVSELMDWVVYSFTRYDFPKRVLLSSTVGTPVDSVVFLYLIGILSFWGVLAMTASKMVGALIVYCLLKKKSYLVLESL